MIKINVTKNAFYSELKQPKGVSEMENKQV